MPVIPQADLNHSTLSKVNDLQDEMVKNHLLNLHAIYKEKFIKFIEDNERFAALCDINLSSDQNMEFIDKQIEDFDLNPDNAQEILEKLNQQANRNDAQKILTRLKIQNLSDNDRLEALIKANLLSDKKKQNTLESLQFNNPEPFKKLIQANELLQALVEIDLSRKEIKRLLGLLLSVYSGEPEENKIVLGILTSLKTEEKIADIKLPEVIKFIDKVKMEAVLNNENYGNTFSFLAQLVLKNPELIEKALANPEVHQFIVDIIKSNANLNDLTNQEQVIQALKQFGDKDPNQFIKFCHRSFFDKLSNYDETMAKSFFTFIQNASVSVDKVKTILNMLTLYSNNTQIRKDDRYLLNWVIKFTKIVIEKNSNIFNKIPNLNQLLQNDLVVKNVRELNDLLQGLENLDLNDDERVNQLNESATLEVLLNRLSTHETIKGPHNILSLGNIDLTQYPNDINEAKDEQSLTIGDLHGNALKLIWILVKQGVLELDKENFEHLAEIYKKSVDDLTEEDLSKFKSILSRTPVKKIACLRLIGDELADRGQNDYFTLLLLERLHKEELNTEILLSNHGVDFLNSYNNIDNPEQAKKSIKIDQRQVPSLMNCQTLIAKKLVTKKEILRIANQAYCPKLKAISYSVDKSIENEPKITLYTHAPVGLETIKAAAELYEVKYDDTSVDALCTTINSINIKLTDDIETGELRAKLDNDRTEKGIPAEEKYALIRLIWNRWEGSTPEIIDNFNQFEVDLPETQHGYTLTLIHGHDGPSAGHIGQIAQRVSNPHGYGGYGIEAAQKRNMVNLDNNNGKSSTSGALHVQVSTDTTAPSLELKSVVNNLEKIVNALNEYKGRKKFVSAQVTKLNNLINKINLPGNVLDKDELVNELNAVHKDLEKAENAHYQHMLFFNHRRSRNSTLAPLLRKAFIPLKSLVKRYKPANNSEAAENDRPNNPLNR